MGLLTLGLGSGGRPATGGMALRVQQTAHPARFNTPVTNPSMYARERMGTDGDVEYAVWTPEADCVYNGRAVDVFLPHGVQLPPGSLDRLRAQLATIRPFTCAVRVSETKGAEHFTIASNRGDE